MPAYLQVTQLNQCSEVYYMMNECYDSFIINEHYMKVLQSHSLQSSAKNNNKSNTSLNKENKPLNTIRRSIVTPFPEPTKKLGIEIRNRIQKPQNLAQQREPMKQSIITTLRDSSFRDSDVFSGKNSRVGKSVSFDENESLNSSLINRHNSRKSILKTSEGKLKKSGSLQKSQVSLANSHVDYQDQSIQNVVGNRVIMDKYERLKQDFRVEGKQYTDEIYPPVSNSIYLNNSLMKNFCQMFEKQGRSIEWMRLSELYKNKKLAVWVSPKSQKSHILKGHISKTGGDGDFLANVFNSIKDKNSLLERLFQSQEVNSQSIYYVKIHQTQTNIWKYLIIDDYIPVIVNKTLPVSQRHLPQNVHPAFLNVYSNSEVLQIWPYLLQKALAKYYSTYDSLGNGNTLDFLQEVAGVFLEQVSVKSNLQKVNKLLKNQDSLVLAQDKRGSFYPLQGFNHQNNEKKYIYLDKQVGYSQKILTSEQFLSKFSTLHFSQLHKYYYTSKCLIQQQNLRKKLQTQKYPYILREFTVTEQCDCQVGTIQKEQRFYRSYLTYQYAWMRVILVEKQIKSYRWIGAVYNNQKSTKIVANLTPGQYVVIIMPEWKDKPYDFNLIYRGNSEILFQRKNYSLYPNIIEQSCMDLAQRYGKMVQVNKNICSYHLIDKNIGFVIENINNQKENGNVRIVRSIQGLQNYHIKPLNGEFKEKAAAQITIAKRSHFTVVLMTTRNTQKGFLQSFDFGF